MSRGFVKDGDIEECPAVEQRAYLPDGCQNYVTAEGLEALRREQAEMIAQRDGASGNETDVRIKRNYLNAKLKLLEERISSAVVPPVPENGLQAGFGAYVTLLSDGGSRQTLRIVGADEADAAQGKISFFSPMATAVSGHRAGDYIEVQMPSGNRRMEIAGISYTPLPLTVLTRATKESEAEAAGADKAPADPETDKSTTANAGETAAKCESAETATAGAPDETAATEPPQMEDEEEMLPLVNERGITVGSATRRKCHGGSRLLHPVVHLHIFNTAGDIYLQLRPSWKKIQPGKWDTACGGHILFGEPAGGALLREALEELGIKEFTPKALKKYVFESDREREYVYLYSTVYDGAISPGDELAGGRFWSRREIEENLGKGVFTPNFEMEFRKYLK